MKFLYVIALGEGTVPYRDETGRHHPGRAMGRSADGKPAAERVADTTYVRRAIGRSELAVVEPTDDFGPVRQLPALESPDPSGDVVTTDAPLVIQRGVAADPHVNSTEI